MTDRDFIGRLLGKHLAGVIDPLLRGSPAAGRLVASMAGTEKLWPLCRRLHSEGLAPQAFRALFSALWVLDHPRIRADVDRETLASMLAFGRFANPPGDTLTVWRGGHGVTAEALAAGWSWSTSYRWAAWFAVARIPGEQSGEPVVIAGEVPAAACWSIPDRMAELAGEVLLGAPPAAVRGVGCPTEWEAEAAWAEAARIAARPLGALGDAAEAMGWVFPPVGPRHAPTPRECQRPLPYGEGDA